MDCVFCDIISGKIPSNLVYREEGIVAFRDVHPRAPVHILIVPQKHIPSLKDVSEEDLPTLARMFKVANEIAKVEGIYNDGYRVVINCGRNGGQIVPHLHLHLLGGRPLSAEIG